MAKAKLLNFRCPDDLWAAIEQIGGDRHPVSEGEEHHKTNEVNPKKFAVTATVLDILRAGISALNGDPSLLDKTEYKTTDKTDIEAMIRAAIAPIEEEVNTIKKL